MAVRRTVEEMEWLIIEYFNIHKKTPLARNTKKIFGFNSFTYTRKKGKTWPECMRELGLWSQKETENINLECFTCGKPFQRNRSQHKRDFENSKTGKVFCSHSCSQTYVNTLPGRRGAKVIICTVCGKRSSYKKKEPWRS